MLINCYYYAPHNHCLLLDHLRHDLDRMADLGCHAVSVCVQEDQLGNWRLALARSRDLTYWEVPRAQVTSDE